jgi:tRNA pseudouridine38-40 synthase
MARYKLTLAYDGTGFYGSQRQLRHRTVQHELEQALGKLGWSAGKIMMAGRTDSGVHASGQVAVADIEWRHSAEALRDALNAELPPDVAVLDARAVDGSFHPRFDAVTRCYEYCLYFSPVRCPLEEHSAWRSWPVPDAGVLDRLADGILGKHDFAAFGSPNRKGGGTQRTIKISRWKRQAKEWRYEIAADGFLYRMVRRLVYVQVAAGQGRCPERIMLGALANSVSAAQVPPGLAPAKGLVLTAVDYGDDNPREGRDATG